MWSQLHIWGNSPGFIYQAPFLPSLRNTPLTQAPSVQFPSYRARYWEGQQETGKTESHRKPLFENHCTPHSGTVKYERFTWSAIDRFSKEHKTLIVSWKRLCVSPEICTPNLIFQRRKDVPFGHMISYTVLQTLGYISRYTVIDYYIAVLTGSSVFPFFKPVS